MTTGYLKVKDIQKALGYGKTKAYQVIAELNAELDAMGYLTRPGWVPAGYFKKRFGMEGDWFDE